MVGNQKTAGVIEMAIDDILESTSNGNYVLRVGYIEVYKEKIFDLLDEKRRSDDKPEAI